MTIEETKKVLAWLGIEPGAVRSTSLTPAECYEALERLVGKGYDVDFSGWRRGGQKQFAIKVKGRDIHVVIALTQHEAIEAAILDLLKAEGGKE